MNTKASVTGLTVETNGITEDQLNDLKAFSGKNAGICYMKDNYFSINIQNKSVAMKRFISTSCLGHHSIADHTNITVVFENISKMLAIVLNSMQNYATSEKSGRYTVMTGNSELERDLYDKWKGIFEERLLYLNPKIDATLCTKLAQENARYVLSVFTRSTTMSYTTSLRQWNYIFDWCEKFTDHYGVDDYSAFKEYIKSGGACERRFEVTYKGEKVSNFITELFCDISILEDFIWNTLYIAELRDNKNRSFDFLCGLGTPGFKHPMDLYDKDKIGDSYSISYNASFVQIAQAQRHRTIKYFMRMIDDEGSPNFFVPPMIKGTCLEKEWNDDLMSIVDLVPQAGLINIIEVGHISNFVLKCEERLCSRAQLETMQQTKNTLELFLDNREKFSSAGRAYLDMVSTREGENGIYECKRKCDILGNCREACSRYSEALERKY